MTPARQLRGVPAATVACLAVPPAVAAVAPSTVAAGPGRVVLGLLFLAPFLLAHLLGWRGGALGTAAALVALLATALLAGPGGLPGAAGLAGLLLLVGAAASASAGVLHHSRLEAEERALSDPGTGLPNRRHGLLHLERAFAAARRGSELAVVMFDLDHFKRVNDRHGHATGDEVLRQFGRVLSHRTREMNLTARMGGEEFVSILENCGAEGARLFAEGVREGLAEVRFPFGRVTASAGVAVYEPGMASPDVLLAAADQALYRAKAGGRDRVEVASGPVAGGSGAPPIPRAELGAEEDRPGSGELLLVVDDDDDARRGVARALRRSGFDVLETGDPHRALRIVRGLERPLDLVLTDVLMPSMSGFRMVELLSDETGPLRVLYMSGYLREEIEWSGAPGAVTAFLSKPVTLEELRRAVNRTLVQPFQPPVATPAPAPVLPGATGSDGSDGPDPAGERIVLVGDGARSLQALSVRLRHLGYDDLEPVALADLPSVDGARPPRLVVAWLEGPAEEALDHLEAFRERFRGGPGRPPLLLMAERLPPEVTGRWPDLFPSLYLPTTSGLGELGLHLQHLADVRARLAGGRDAVEAMEARVEAGTAALEAAYGDLVMRLARASEIKDDATGRHGERVSRTTRKLALEMGLSEARAHEIGQAAALHDLGKIAIPDAILDKPGELTPTERQLVERHTVAGAELLAGSRHPVLQEAERITRSHHERWDGTGYPDGLAGEAIPLGARIVAVADVFDVVTHARSYLEASSTERALSVVREGRGTYFDPQVVAALEALDRRGELSPDPDRGPVAPPDATPRSPLEVRALLEELEWS